MLIKINNTLIDVANIVAAHFTPTTDKLKGALTIICVHKNSDTLHPLLTEGLLTSKL